MCPCRLREPAGASTGGTAAFQAAPPLDFVDRLNAIGTVIARRVDLRTDREGDQFVARIWDKQRLERTGVELPIQPSDCHVAGQYDNHLGRSSMIDAIQVSLPLRRLGEFQDSKPLWDRS